VARHRTHSIEFKRLVAQEFLAGETLHDLAKRYKARALEEKAVALICSSGRKRGTPTSNALSAARLWKARRAQRCLHPWGR
jgi:uncharacterized protein with von Willebrand factor type A (vWA) domain